MLNSKYSQPTLSPASDEVPDGINIVGQALNVTDIQNSTFMNFMVDRVNFMLLGWNDGAVVTAAKARNSSLEVIQQNNAYVGRYSTAWDGLTAQQITDQEALWGVRDQNDNLLTFDPSIYGGLENQDLLQIFDIQNAAYRADFCYESRAQVDAMGADGVFNDTLEPAWPPLNETLPKDYDANNWRSSTHLFLDTMIANYAGSSKKIYFNGVSRPPGVTGDLVNRDMLIKDKVGGATIEANSVLSPMDLNNTSLEWYITETCLTDIPKVTALGKKAIMEVTCNSEAESTRLYALCGFLMVQTDDTFFYYTKTTDAGGFVWRPEWSLQLGKALRPYRRWENGMLLREFANGIAVVNPTNQTLSGQEDLLYAYHPQLITLQPYTGAIYMRS